MFPPPISLETMKKRLIAAKRFKRAIENRIKLEPGMRSSFENAERKMSQMQGSTDEVDEEQVQKNVELLMANNPHRIEYNNAHEEYCMVMMQA